MFPTLDQLRVEALEPDPPFWMSGSNRAYWGIWADSTLSRKSSKCFLVFAWQYGGLQFGMYEVYLIQERLSSKGEKENSVEWIGLFSNSLSILVQSSNSSVTILLDKKHTRFNNVQSHERTFLKLTLGKVVRLYLISSRTQHFVLLWVHEKNLQNEMQECLGKTQMKIKF